MKKCNECEKKKFIELMRDIARQSKLVTHINENGVKEYENMVNTINIINFIIDNFKLK